MVSIKLVNVKLKMYSIYRPPKYEIKEFMVVLHELLLSQSDTAIIVGDMNVDILDRNSGITSSYMNMITMAGFRICNGSSKQDGTRNNKTLLDHVLVNKKVNCEVSPIMYKLSDHLPLGIDVYENIKLFKPKTIKYVNIVNPDRYKDSFSNLGNRIEDTLIKSIEFRSEGNDWVPT